MQRKPDWLKIKLSGGEDYGKVEAVLKSLSLHTVCEEADCPNRAECFGRGTATFMILGSVCTRNCRFCAVNGGKPLPPDPEEPGHIAQAVSALGLRHVVVTTVTRDDLPDGGASHFARVIGEIRKASLGTTVEVLISDLKGDKDALKKITDARPDILGHNVETVPRLYRAARPQAVYERSLGVLKGIKELCPDILSKTGVMAGLGETRGEMTEVFSDLRRVKCDILTVGQYLAPSKEHLPVAEYVHPDTFRAYAEEARGMGFRYVVSGPLVRSSYRAEQALEK